MTKESYEQELKFNVQQILNSNKFIILDKDVLKAMLNEEIRYSLDEATYILEQFKKGDVK